MPRFELGTKFWSAERRAGSIDVRWGELGTQGLMARLRDQGQHELTALIAAKLAEGYVEVAVARWTRRYVSRESGERFLEVTLDGRRVYQRQADGAPAELVTHPMAQIARKIAEQIVSGALAHGLELVHEIVPAVDLPPSTARNLELAAACRAAPDDPEPRAVYADWLMSNSDVRGEVAALINSNDPSAVERLLAVRLALFGGRTDLSDAVEIAEYRFGFPRAVDIGYTSWGDNVDELVAALLESPLVELLETLRVRGPRLVNWTRVVDAIARSSHATTLSELELDGCEPATAALLHRLPGLTTLCISGTPGAHSTLRTLAMRAAHPADVDALARAALPALERLELHGVFVGSDVVSSGLLARTDLPGLRHFKFDTDLAGPLIATLARSPLLPRLRTLDLSASQLTAPGGRQLADDAAAFRHLEQLTLGPHVGGRIARALPNVRVVGER